MPFEVTPTQQKHLLAEARRVARLAYAPYSHFRVGAAILAANGIYLGANVENASYGLSLCAERAAFVHAISSGEREFHAIAVACLDATPSPETIQHVLPCGACRQWMAEFNPNITIFIAGAAQPFTLQDLLPKPFLLKSADTSN